MGNTNIPVYDLPFVNAAGWLISKECLMTVGGFDPMFFHYGEDDNYCQRVLFHEFKIGVLPNALMVHDREDREKPKIEPYTDAYFNLQERRFKIRFGNINNYKPSALKKEEKKLKRQLFKARLRRNTKAIQGLKQLLVLLKKCIVDISHSIRLNKQQQPNYLDITPKGRHY